MTLKYPIFGSYQGTSLTINALSLHSLLNLTPSHRIVTRILHFRGSFSGPELNLGLCPATALLSSRLLM